MTALPPIVSFWHGELGWLGRVAIASFLDKGHSFSLYTYADVGPVPNGCELRDANTIIPQSEMFFYKGSRTPAVFADLFRLKLMQQSAGIWVDCDVYCVRPYEGLGELVVGIEDDHSRWHYGQAVVNNAVFRCPADSELLRLLLSTFEPGAIPAGMPIRRAIEVRLRRLMGENLPVQHMQFGATGPWPLNHYLRQLDLFNLAQPRTVFYPIGYDDAAKLLTPGLSLPDIVNPETLSVHLWHSALTDRGTGKLRMPAPGSFFAHEMQRLGVSG
jgi:hypothetical protein